MIISHIKPLHQVEPDQIVRFDTVTESCIHPHLHQKMGVQMFASFLVYHFWTLHEEPTYIKSKNEKALQFVRSIIKWRM